MAEVIDGKRIAADLCTRIAEQVTRLQDEHGVTPGLAVVLVGENPASQVYVRNKRQQAEIAGIASFEYKLPADVPSSALLDLIDRLNEDPKVHGILVQLPLPAHLDPQLVVAAIDPAKDVDGFAPINVGLLLSGGDGFIPCTPLGCLMLLRHCLQDLTGLQALVVGRSTIVGKPMAVLLLRENCTVTIAHSYTRDLASACSRADILIAAVGRPRFIQGHWIKPGATVIDVGINRVETQANKTELVGDVDYVEALPRVNAITPVPGGVGPMTIACLLFNTLKATCHRLNIPTPVLENL